MRIFRIILVVLILLGIAAAVGAFFYANHYVNSPAFKDRLVAEISAATGGTVQIEAVSVSLFREVEVGGIKLSRQNKQIGSRSYSTSAKKIEVSFNLWSLLRNKVEITGLYMDSPDIKIVSSPSRPATVGQADSSFPDGNEPLAQTPEPGATVPAQASPPAEVKKSDFELVIQRAEVRNGRLDITLPNGKRVLIEDFNFKSFFHGKDDIPEFVGDATCGTVTIDGLPPITKVQTEFRFAEDILTIRSASGTMARGKVETKGEVNISKNQPFDLQIDISGLDPKILLSKKPEIASAVDGVVNGEVTLNGTFEEPLELTGEGSAELKDGRITTKPIQFLIFTYQIPELQTIDMEHCGTTFTIGRHKINFTEIAARSKNVRLLGSGWYDFIEDTIDLNLEPGISQVVKDRLPIPIAIGFRNEIAGYYTIAFRAWGPLDHLQNDVASQFAEGAWKTFLSTELPQNIMNNTFDTLEGIIQGSAGAATNAPSVLKGLEGLFKPTAKTNAAPTAAPAPEPSTNAAPTETPLREEVDPIQPVEDILKGILE